MVVTLRKLNPAASWQFHLFHRCSKCLTHQGIIKWRLITIKTVINRHWIIVLIKWNHMLFNREVIGTTWNTRVFGRRSGKSVAMGAGVPNAMECRCLLVLVQL